MNLFHRLFGKPLAPQCRHERLISHIETVNGKLMNVQDECQDCPWKSPRFEEPDDSVKFYAAQYHRRRQLAGLE